MAAALALVVCASCGGSRAAPSAERELLILGAVASPGASAPDSDSTVRAVQLAVREYNRNPDSTYQIRLGKSGGKGQDPAVFSKQLANQERMIGVVAGPASGQAASLGAAFQTDAIPLLTTSDSTALPAAGWRNFRRLVASERAEGAAVAEAVSRKVKGAAIIFHDNSPAGRAFGEGVKSFMEKAKRPVPRFEKISANTSLGDLAGAVAQDPQAAVIFGGAGDLGIRLGAELRKVRFKAQVGASAQALSVKAGTVPDAMVAASGVADPDDSRIADFKAKYRQAYQAAPPPNAVEAYEGAQMLLEAIEEVDPKPKSITDFFALNRRFLGDSKVYEYDDKGELTSPRVWLYESQGGNWEPGGSVPVR